MIIIIIFFPLTILFAPSKYCCSQDNRNNLNRKIGKWENRKIRNWGVLCDLCKNSFRKVWKCLELFVTLQGVRKYIIIWKIEVSKSPNTPVLCCSS